MAAPSRWHMGWAHGAGKEKRSERERERTRESARERERVSDLGADGGGVVLVSRRVPHQVGLGAEVVFLTFVSGVHNLAGVVEHYIRVKLSSGRHEIARTRRERVQLLSIHQIESNPPTVGITYLRKVLPTYGR